LLSTLFSPRQLRLAHRERVWYVRAAALDRLSLRLHEVLVRGTGSKRLARMFGTLAGSVPAS
jgi:hypothetical protein